MFNDVPSDDFTEIENPERKESLRGETSSLENQEEKSTIPNFFIMEDMQPLYYFNVKQTKDLEDVTAIE